MPDFVISDLHTCDRGRRDSFHLGGREKRFWKFADYVQAEQGQLYIAGDLADWLQVSYRNWFLNYRGFIDQLARRIAGWVPGNHDGMFLGLARDELPDHPIFGKYRCGPMEIERGGRKILIYHGSEADPYCSSGNPGVGELTAIITGWLEDRYGPRDRWGRWVEDAFLAGLEGLVWLHRHLHRKKQRRQEQIEGMDGLREVDGADAMIYGHTHELGSFEDRLFNSGCWHRDRDSYVRVENDGHIGVWEWTKDCCPMQIEQALI